jgi:PadR family transcriptional regulator
MDVAAKRSDNLQGSLELVILKTLERGPNHGFGITVHVQTVSEGLLRVEEGSLYPALHRMERAKLIKGQWRKTENRRRARFYELTAAGARRLAEAERSWTAVSAGVGKLLSFV